MLCVRVHVMQDFWVHGNSVWMSQSNWGPGPWLHGLGQRDTAGAWSEHEILMVFAPRLYLSGLRCAYAGVNRYLGLDEFSYHGLQEEDAG